MNKEQSLRAISRLLPAVGLMTVTSIASAQNEFAEPVELEQIVEAIDEGSNWSFAADTTFTTEYWFRGISQGKQNINGLIIQPSAAATYQLSDGISATFGLWSSFSTTDRDGDSAWYEADPSLGLSFQLSDTLFADITYIWLENPSGGGEFNQEIDFSISHDDSGFWEDLGVEIPGFEGLQPYALVAFETSSAADGFGNADGIYLEAGIAPSVLIYDSETTPITLSVPITFGFNADKYYQTGSNGDGDFFGFTQIGFHTSMPLEFISPRDGSWELHAGIDFLMLSDQLQEISEAAGTGDDETRVITSFGLSVSF
ncbi:hypothetical protein JD969_19355 [Planctomycetota bacterium]|nr:hypothetical protein JD969_19355 [Planctomycetota bacterium]